MREFPAKPDFDAFLQRLAAAAAAAVLPYFRAEFSVQNKNTGFAADRFDPVTQADKACELALRRLISARYPEHGIWGEEYGAQNAQADYVWILDPIDGTRAFMSGLPLWGTLIGLNYKDRPVLGAMIQPFLQELFFGNGKGAWLAPLKDQPPVKSQPLKTRSTRQLEEAIVFTTDPDLFNAEERARFQAVQRRCQLCRYGLDCYGYAMVAAGFADLVIETGLQVYDIAPLIPVIEGAGGVVTDWQGGPAGQIYPSGGRQVVAAANPTLHALALELLGR